MVIRLVEGLNKGSYSKSGPSVDLKVKCLNQKPGCPKEKVRTCIAVLDYNGWKKGKCSNKVC